MSGRPGARAPRAGAASGGGAGSGDGAAETTYRGVEWRRDAEGRIHFHDTDGDRWVAWRPGVDAPPLPPGWSYVGIRRAPWYTGWRLIPVTLAVFAVVIAIVQATGSSSDNAKKEAAASEALLGKCLAQDGTLDGHPKYSASPVSCDSSKASIKVIAVLPPGSPVCERGTVGLELPYAGVANPHVECVEPVHRSG